VAYAEKYGKLSKTLKESLSDFSELYGEAVQNYTSYEVGVLFDMYIVDYLPFSSESEKPKEKEAEREEAEVDVEPKPISRSEQAQRLRAKGLSYVEIGKRLGISDKTAKKLCEA
jgi:DNA-binding NarL/FixJ family response regulator